MGDKIQNAIPTTVTVLFSSKLFRMVPVTVHTKVAYRNFENSDHFFLKRLKFNMGKFQNATSPTVIILSHPNFL